MFELDTYKIPGKCPNCGHIQKLFRMTYKHKKKFPCEECQEKVNFKPLPASERIELNKQARM
jgi:hypothetical protein